MQSVYWIATIGVAGTVLGTLLGASVGPVIQARLTKQQKILEHQQARQLARDERAWESQVEMLRYLVRLAHRVMYWPLENDPHQAWETYGVLTQQMAGHLSHELPLWGSDNLREAWADLQLALIELAETRLADEEQIRILEKLSKAAHDAGDVTEEVRRMEQAKRFEEPWWQAIRSALRQPDAAVGAAVQGLIHAASREARA